jgi:hypothetical protein
MEFYTCINQVYSILSKRLPGAGPGGPGRPACDGVHGAFSAREARVYGMAQSLNLIVPPAGIGILAWAEMLPV